MAEQSKNPLSGVASSPAADRVKSEIQKYAMAQAERLLVGAGRKLGESTNKLTDIAEGRSPGFAKLALDGGKKLAEGKGPMRSAVELGATNLKDKVTDGVKGLFGGKGKKKGGSGQKPTVILESIDVGVPLRDAYDQWTQYQEFSTFAKGVKSASAADDTHSDWQAKIFWSSRSWKATTTEQIPDHRIVWTSEGAKGSTKGVVTFHELAPHMTRVLLVIEYYPKGLFEKTGNIWRAQGRRARLDLKHYARFISMRGEASDGWRGEIQDGEVVRTHEEALEAEEAESQDQAEDAEGADDSEESEEAREDEPEDEYEEEDAPEGEYEDEDEEEDVPEEEDEEEDVPEDEYEEEEEDEESGREGARAEDEAEDEADDRAEDESDEEEDDADAEKRREYAESRGR